MFFPAGHKYVSLSTHTCITVILFCVKVPVLSEAMIVVEPKVSTASKFFTKTFFVCIRFAVNARDTVTVANKPSGTFATMIPIINTTFWIMSVPLVKPMMKNTTPKVMATAEIN